MNIEVLLQEQDALEREHDDDKDKDPAISKHSITTIDDSNNEIKKWHDATVKYSYLGVYVFVSNYNPSFYLLLSLMTL